MHSRNSCKTLKCPRCNWHYKYQETLEIHMKEKHPENENSCFFCLSNQSHPRLARGETYTCGYKPYRCEVCNYSTTTKGNLSIHMTSDKHMTNIQQYDASAAQMASANKLAAMGVVAAAAAANNNNNNNTRDSTASPSNSSSASANGGQLTNTSSEQASSNNQFAPDDTLGHQQQSLATSISNALALAAAAANNNNNNNSSSSASSSPISSLNQHQQQNPFTTTSSNNINLTQASALMTNSGQFAPPINSQSKMSQEAMNMLQQQLSSALPAITTATSSPNAINTNSSDCVEGIATIQDQAQQQPQQTAAALAAILLAQQNPNALEDYINSQEIAKDSYDDPSRKYKCHRCKVAFTRQSYLTAHNKTLFHRKGEKLAYPMEKYLDPNRPFKCDICKESFTQKSILLVHNNSVSHLNKLRQSKKLQQQQQANSADQAPQQATANANSNDRSTTSTPINTNVNNNNLITSTPPHNAFGAMSPQVSQALQQHLQNQQATTSASNTNMPAANALASHLSMLQQQATNPLAAALQADPMSALMAGGNPMAALLMASASQMSHPMMPFMMNPQLMAAAALAAAHSSRAMLDPQAAAAAAAASMFQQPQLTPKSAASPNASSNPFLDFQNQQQHLMQQAASQLAAAVASQAGPAQQQQNDLRSSSVNTVASSNAYSLGNLLSNQGVSAVDFIQQSLAAAGNPLQALMGANKLTPDTMMNSPLNGLKNHLGISINNTSGAPSLASTTPITSSAPSNNQHHQAQNDQAAAAAAATAAAAAAAAAAALSVQQQKRARTRISEDQLRILRQYFDINNSPTEEQLQEMSVKSELPLKVIKHWFRNTLFKERQKNKDSPYNFNNPPMLALNLEEYERTGEAKVTPISDLVSQSMNQNQAVVAATTILNSLNNLQQQAPNLMLNSPAAAAAPPKDEYQFNDSLATKEGSIEAAAAAVVRDVVEAVASEVVTPPGGPDVSSLKRTRSTRNHVDVKRPRSDSNQDQVKKEILDAQQQLADNSNNPYLSQSERLMILFNNLQRQSGGATEANVANSIDLQAGSGPRRDCDSDSAPDSDDSQGSSFSANNNNNNSPDGAKLKQNTGNSKHQSSRKASHQQQVNRQLRRSKRLDQPDALSPVQDENAGIGPSSTWSPLQLQQQLFDQTWATVNNHFNNNSDNANRQGLSSKTSDSSSHSVNSNNSKSKRANRTRFSDQQVKVLQEFFEQNAYPKDDDLECLSKQLGLSPRVIVVWFQNARQKARKVYENRPTSASMSEGEDDQIMSMNQNRLHNQSFSFNTSGTCDSPTSGAAGPHSPTSSLMSNNDHQNQSRAPSQHQATLMQQRQLEQFFMDQLDRGANRTGEDEDEMEQNIQGGNQARASRSRVQKRLKREFEDEHNNDGDDEVDGEEGDDEHGSHHNHDAEEDDDDDEFMSAAQMMRQQQQQQQQSQQLAAAAAGLFSGDPASLLQQLFAANQQHGGANLFQQQQQQHSSNDINQRNVMEALSNAMRAATASSGVANANTIGGGATNNNAGANNGLMSHLIDGGSQASMISGGGATGANNRHCASATNGGLISASSTSSNNTTTTTSTTTSTSSASQRDKRLRTQISPEQLDYLYQKYQVESNPSRKTLESIAQDVGLSKRVVQVWFQNTRARERRGQLRMSHVFAQQQRSQAAAAAAAAAAAVLDLSART